MKKAILVVKKIAASILHFLQSSIDGSWRERERVGRGWQSHDRTEGGTQMDRDKGVCVCAVQRCWLAHFAPSLA